LIIQNRDSLLSHGNVGIRRHALDILEAGLRAADPYQATTRLIRIVGDHLYIGGHPEMDVSGFGDEVIDLREIDNIYMIGAGKAVQRQAQALEDILGDRLTAGAITAKKGEGAYLRRIEVTEGAHPVPNEDSLAGARKIVEIARRATERDLVFTAFSDGASSLFTLPAEGFTLDDLRALYRLSIKFGVQSIITRPMVYFSQVSCGRIARMIHPARAVHLILCTVPYRRWNGVLPTSQIFVPTWPSGLRRMDAAVREYKLEPWYEELPPAMHDALERKESRLEVPDLDDFRRMRISYWQPVDSQQMLRAAKCEAERLGYHGAILGLWSMINTSELAHMHGGMVRQVVRSGEPFPAPVALLSTGEMSTPVGSTTGIGGRNQEFALRVAQQLGGEAPPNTFPALETGEPIGEHIVVASVDSDGTDGPGNQFNKSAPDDFRCQAGGITDGSTLCRARELGIDLDAELRNHASSVPLLKLGDSIYTGNTGSCLGDLRLVLIPGR
jgi:glycerate 2-kinase